MKLLRRVLLWQAALWAVFGLAIATAPGTVLVDLFAQERPVDTAFPRLAGVGAFCLALNMVLVAQRIEEIWWFSWTFVVLEAGTVAVSFANALGARPSGSGSILWWLLTVMGRRSWHCWLRVSPKRARRDRLRDKELRREEAPEKGWP